MFTRKRRLKKEKKNIRLKYFIVSVFVVLFVVAAGELISLNLSFGRVSYISPVTSFKSTEIVALEDKLSKTNIQFSEISAGNNGFITVKLKDGGEVILSSKKDIESQISSLQLILSRLTIEGKRLEKLDFRFDNPVVLTD